MMDTRQGPFLQWILWLNVLSLDAPLVAVTWQWAISREIGAEIGWPYHLLLGGCVWCLYTADRLIDSIRIQPREHPARRRLFAQRHFRSLSILCGLATLSMVALSIGLLPGKVFTNWAMVGAGIAGYFLLIHAIGLKNQSIPKEFLVALLFAAGSTVLPLSGERNGEANIIIPFVTLFLVLFANAWLISKWERPLDRGSIQPSIALDYPVATRFLPAYLVFLTLGGVAASYFGTTSRPFGSSLAVSAGLLMALDFAGDGLDVAVRRELADLALLTPLIFF